LLLFNKDNPTGFPTCLVICLKTKKKAHGSGILLLTIGYVEKIIPPVPFYFPSAFITFSSSVDQIE